MLHSKKTLLKFLLCFSFSLFSISVIAQEKISLELALQPSVTSIYGTQKRYNPYVPNEKKFQKGFTPGHEIGLFGEYYFSKKISIGSGLIYSHQGQNYNNLNLNGYSFKLKTRLDYLKIPLKINYSFPIKNDLSLIFSSGLYWGRLKKYAVRETLPSGILGDKVTTFIYTDHDDSKRFRKIFKKNDYGISFSTGFQKNITTYLLLTCALKYEFGLSDIRKMRGTRKRSGYYYYRYEKDIATKQRNALLGLKIGLKKFF